MEIECLNLVNENTAVTPNYKLAGRVNSIIAYLNYLEDLIIIGRVDNNYIYWASKTKASDKKTNEQIFNRLADGVFEMASETGRVLESIGISYEEFRRFYKERYDRGNEKEPEKLWKRSSGVYYRKEDKQQHGRYFAYDMEGMLRQQQRKCRAREADGEYFKVLEKYLKKLIKAKNNPYYYEEESELMELLEGESYLLLSKDGRVRNTYYLIQQEIRGLYCMYMSAIK